MSKNSTTTTNNAPKLLTAFVNNVFSGDSLVLCNPNDKRMKKNFTICNLITPRMAKKGEEKDEPFAFDAKEFVRQKCVGKKVDFQVTSTNKMSGKDYGILYVNDNGKRINVGVELVRNGLAKVKPLQGYAAEDESYKELLSAQEYAEAEELGLHSKDNKYIEEHSKNVIKVKDANKFLEKYKNKKTNVVVEYCMNASTLKVVTPDKKSVVLSMSGIQCPTTKYETKKGAATKTKDSEGKEDRVLVTQPFTAEALKHTQDNLLQREVTVIFEALDKGDTFFGTVYKPGQDKTFQEDLLSMGLAKIANWSIAHTKFSKKLEAAERVAKDKKLRIFKNYVEPAKTVTKDDQDSFSATVVDVISGDTLKIKSKNGVEEKISLSSVKSQRYGSYSSNKPEPFAVEARDALRKRVAGKTLKVKCDYRRELKVTKTETVKEGDKTVTKKIEGTEPRRYCTITVNDKNVAIPLIKSGYAIAIKHKYGEERSQDHSKYLTAENSAKEKKIGIHGNKKNFPVYNINDLTGLESTKLQKSLSLIKNKRTKAVVERVYSANRFKLSLPNDSLILNFSLIGLGTPSVRSEDPKVVQVAKDGLVFTLDKCILQDVEIFVYDVDKRGSFTGELHLSNGEDISKSILAEGYAFLIGTARKLKHYSELEREEKIARSEEKNIFSIKDFFKPREVENVASKDIVIGNKNEPAKLARVTEVVSANELYIQTSESIEPLKKIDELIENMSLDYMKQSVRVKVGDRCLAKFSEDGSWYRSSVLSTNKSKSRVLFIDYGNVSEVPTDDIRSMEKKSEIAAIPPQAQRITLAFTRAHEENSVEECVDMLNDTVFDKDFEVYFEYQIKRQKFCTLINKETKKNLSAELIESGLLFFDSPEFLKDNEDFKSKLEFIKTKQDSAKEKKLGLWENGDIY